MTVRSSRTVEASCACLAVSLSRAASCLEIFAHGAGVLTNVHCALVARTSLALAVVARLALERVLRANSLARAFWASLAKLTRSALSESVEHTG